MFLRAYVELLKEGNDVGVLKEDTNCYKYKDRIFFCKEYESVKGRSELVKGDGASTKKESTLYVSNNKQCKVRVTERRV